MKFSSKADNAVIIAFVILGLITFGFYILWALSHVWWPALVFSIISILGALPIFVYTNYVIDDRCLTLHFGIFSKKIALQNIVSATDADGYSPAFALSHKRICLRYMENSELKCTYISPANRNQFRTILSTAISDAVVKRTPETKSQATDSFVVEQIKDQLAENKLKNRAEERELESKQKDKNINSITTMNQELKKIEEIINGNISEQDVVLTKEQEDLLQKSKSAEQKINKRINSELKKQSKSSTITPSQKDDKSKKKKTLKKVNVR